MTKRYCLYFNYACIQFSRVCSYYVVNNNAHSPMYYPAMDNWGDSYRKANLSIYIYIYSFICNYILIIKMNYVNVPFWSLVNIQNVRHHKLEFQTLISYSFMLKCHHSVQIRTSFYYDSRSKEQPLFFLQNQSINMLNSLK